MSWDEERRVDEKRAGLPDTVRGHRSRKDRRRWCRGKRGAPHSEPLGRRIRQPVTWLPADGTRCFRPEWSPDRWWCRHEDYCTQCGKVMRRSLDRECPDFTTDVTMFSVVFDRSRRP